MTGAGTVAAPRAGLRADAAAWSALAVAGLAFWFFVGFPFGHHNESYDWVAWIGTPDLSSVAWHSFFGSGGYRPLSMSIAWLLYRVGDGSLVPIQLFNFTLTVIAWTLLAAAAPFRRTFALAALVSGGVLFAGYIFLFHLHGVFYGPLLLLLALLVRASERPPAAGRLGLLIVLAAVVAAAHTFALAFTVAFVAGLAIERGWLRDRRRLLAGVAIAVVGVALIGLVAPKALWSASVVERGTLALVTSFRAFEVNRVVTVVLALLAAATAATTATPRPFVGGVRIAGALGVAAVAAAAGAPLGFVWIAFGLVKTVVHGRWTLAFLLLASLALPYAGLSGSPTYALFTFALLTWILALDAPAIEARLAFLRPAHAWALTGVLVLLGAAVGNGVPVPLVTRLAHPVLAEKERTHQGEVLLERVLASDWRTHPIRLAVDQAAPTEARGAVERGERAPTNQICLDNYLLHRRGAADPTATPVILSFGVEATERKPGSAFLVVPGRHAGDAMAVLAGPPDSAATP